MRDNEVRELPKVFLDYGMILCFTKELTLDRAIKDISESVSYDDWKGLHETMHWEIRPMC